MTGCAQVGSFAPLAAGATEVSLKQWQIIGEGSDFLTVMIQVPPAQAAQLELNGVVLDDQGFPLRHISAIAWASDQTPIGHKWLSFVVYAPSRLPEVLRMSSAVELTLHGAPGQDTAVELVDRFAYRKNWGASVQPEIFDGPVPPEKIAGVVQLQDYTFIGPNHGRSVQGPVVAGYISGREGRWPMFVPTSNAIEGVALSSVGLIHERGWLELTQGETHADQEARAPSSPYVSGWWDGKGLFHPEGALVR
jgi:hypothetical protein